MVLTAKLLRIKKYSLSVNYLTDCICYNQLCLITIMHPYNY